MLTQNLTGEKGGEIEKNRQVSRLKHQVSIAYSYDLNNWHDKDSASYLFGTLMDISDRGLCFQTADNLNGQKMLSMYLKLSHQTSGIMMLGKVVWIKQEAEGDNRVGVQFIGNLPPQWYGIVQQARIPG